MKKLVASMAVCCSLCLIGYGQKVLKEDADFLRNLMARDRKSFGLILDHADSLEVQIIYSIIDRNDDYTPRFRTFYYNVDPDRYFYPASTVKLPVVMLALEKLRKLHITGLDYDTPMFHDSVYSGQVSVRRDTTSRTNLPSVAHYIKKILVASDNDAYNRLYEFVGQKAINERLHALGYRRTRILHRLERPLTRDENAHTEAIRFVKNGKTLLRQPMQVNLPLIEAPQKVLRGTGFMRNDSLIHEPFDFTYKNFFPLTEQHEMLKAILFPESVPAAMRFAVSPEDKKLVVKCMGQLPRETRYPPYATTEGYYDSYCKFLMFGGLHTQIPNAIRIFNKSGDAYGYMIDNAYIVNYDTGTEFLLSAVINTNTDGIYNDGKYAYETLGLPFLRKLGEAIYRYESEEINKGLMPEFSAFTFYFDETVETKKEH